MLLRNVLLLLLLLAATAAPSRADDGYHLWLEYDRLADAGQRTQRRAALQSSAAASNYMVVKTAAAELQRGLQGLLGQPVLAKAENTAAKRGILLAFADENCSLPNAAPQCGHSSFTR